MIGFRVDMNNIIATGHVMRCLSIASAAKNMGIDSTFFLADEQAKEIIEKQGFKTIILNSQWDDLESEFPVLEEYISKLKVKNLVIDTYQVTSKYLEELTACTRTFYIDDMNKFLYPVHGIICYSNYWRKFDYQFRYEEAVKEGELSFVPEFILGCNYVPLRGEFQGITKKKIADKIENILILSGGTDNLNILENILNVLPLEKYRRIDVVCGKYYNNFRYLKNKFLTYPNVHIHKQINNLIDYMKISDVTISAGGTTLYELCAVGTPTISYSFVDNQLDNVKQFATDGVIKYAGDVRYNSVYENVYSILEGDYAARETRQNISEKMRMMIDGLGAQRIIERIII